MTATTVERTARDAGTRRTRTPERTSPANYRADGAYRPVRRTRRRMTPFQRFLRHHAYPLFMFFLGIAVAAAITNVMGRNRTNDYGRELRYAYYTVSAGDTMWDIAVDMAAANPEFTDVRQYLSLLQKTNRNYGDYLQEGTEIVIPYYATPGDKTGNGQRSLEDTIMGTYARYGIIDYGAWTDILSGK